MASHAVVFLDHPPAFLNITARVARAILILSRKGTLFASQQEGCEGANLLRGEVQIGHAQGFGLRFDLALIVNVRLGKFVLEETFVVVPWPRCRTLRESRQVFWIRDRLGMFSAALSRFSEQSEIQPLDRLAAFKCQFRADAAFILHA